MEDQEIEEMNQTQQLPWLVNNIIFCYNREKHTGNDIDRKNHFLKHNGGHNSRKEAYIDGSKSTGGNVGFAAVFTNITRRGALPEEESNYTAAITAIKIAMREKQTR